MSIIKSRQPRTQRKRRAQAGYHLLRKFVRAPLSKELRKSSGKRTATVHKGDEVKILVGKFRGVKGKVIEVDLKNSRISVEGAIVRLSAGREKPVPLQAANVVILTSTAAPKKSSAQKTKPASAPSTTKPASPAIASHSPEHKVPASAPTATTSPA